MGHRLVVVRKKEFVANRLAFVLFHEACRLMLEGVEDVDAIVESSVGLRWGVVCELT